MGGGPPPYGAPPPPPFTVDLYWDAASDCQGKVRTLDGLEKLLPRRGPRLASIEAWVEVHMRQTGRLELRLATRRQGEPAHERRLLGMTCEEVADAAAAVLALAITAERPPPPVPVVAAGDLAPPPIPIADRPRIPSYARLAVGVSGFLDGWSLPSPAAGMSLSVAAYIDPLRLEVFGVFLPARRARPTAAVAGADIMVGGGGLRVCHLPWVRGFEVSYCLGVEVGGMFGTGVGVDSPSSTYTAWLAPEVNARVYYGFNRTFGFFGDIEGLTNLAPVNFTIRGLSVPAFSSSRLTGRLSLGFEVRFP